MIHNHPTFTRYIVRTFGIWLFPLVSIFAATVWLFAHYASKPGTEVRVLWGLVEYTKQTPNSQPSTADASDALEHEQSTSNSQPSTADASDALEHEQSTPTGQLSTDDTSDKMEYDQSTPTDQQINSDTLNDPILSSESSKTKDLIPINLDVMYDLTSENYTKRVESLRARYNLRKISLLETERPLRLSAPRTYSFLLVAHLGIQGKQDDLLDTPSYGVRRGERAVIEVHHRDPGHFILLAFVTETDGDRIRELDGRSEHKITFAPTYWGPFSVIIELPIDRIVKAEDRSLDISELERLEVLDVTIR